jgi:hypothetical protein
LVNHLPSEVLSVLREFRTCEFTTLSKNGTPIAWPVSARYLADQGCFLMTTSIGLPQKALNIRRNPKVSMLFSNPTASGLANPPAVLVQGDASALDEIVTSVNAMEGLREYWLESIFRRQPPSEMISANPLMRNIMDWYYMRIVITIVPRAVFWWPNRDFTQPARKVEAAHVE